LKRAGNAVGKQAAENKSNSSGNRAEQKPPTLARLTSRDAKILFGDTTKGLTVGKRPRLDSSMSGLRQAALEQDSSKEIQASKEAQSLTKKEEAEQ